MGRDKKAARADRSFMGSIHGNISEADHHHHHHHGTKSDIERNHDVVLFKSDDQFIEDEPQDTADHDRMIYWESQHFLLQEILDQYKSVDSKLREQINREIGIVRGSKFCSCPDKSVRGCIKCLRRAAVNQLRIKGFDAALCTSEWKRTHKTPGGRHEYIEVIASTQGRRKQTPLVVELGFWDAFRMAKACDEYNKLINQLPEIYIGKSEHLNAIIRVVCEAAKKSFEEQKIHLGPWRKRSFMQMKWSLTTERSFLDHSSNQLWISSSGQERVNSAAICFHLPAGAAVKSLNNVPCYTSQ